MCALGMRLLLLSLVTTGVTAWLAPFVLPARRTCCVMLSDDLSAFTVPQLKEKLRSANLPVSGRKAELIARLSGAPTDSPAALVAPAFAAASTVPVPSSGATTKGPPVSSSRYIREAGDTAPVNVEAVQKILSERDDARAARDWSRADALRDTLADAHGVTVQDNEQKWYVGGRAGRDGPGGAGRRNRESRFDDRRFDEPGRYEAGRGERRDDGGNSGYDRGGRDERRYDGGNSGYARDDREQGRYGRSDGDGPSGYGAGSAPRRYTGGDPAGQQRYVPPAGGGYNSNSDRGGVDPRARRRERDARRMQTRNAPYARAQECEASLEAAKVSEIDDLVNMRLRKKLDRRFDEADDLLRQLEGSYGVAVSDDARQWRADGMSFVYAYRRDGSDGGRSAAEVTAVDKLMRKRGVAKSRKQFDESDGLLKEIRDMGAEVDDKARSWWFVGGGGGGTFAARGGGAGYRRDGSTSGSDGNGWIAGRARLDRGQLHDYTRSQTDDYDLGIEQLDKVDELLGRRLAAKRARDFDRADLLQTELRELGIEVDDKAKQWYIRYGDGERTASSYNVRGR